MSHEELIRKLLRRMVKTSRARAATRAIEHNLPDDHAEHLYAQQNGRCGVTGLEFSMQLFSDAFVRHPFAPSMDRQDSKLGYTVGNVRLVFTCVNFGLGQWGQEVYLRCARAAVEHDDALTRAFDAMTSTKIGEKQTSIQPLRNPEWEAMMRERIDAAQAISKELAGSDLSRQNRRIASLKRNLNLGQVGLTLAATRAAKTRAERHGR